MCCRNYSSTKTDVFQQNNNVTNATDKKVTLLIRFHSFSEAAIMMSAKYLMSSLTRNVSWVRHVSTSSRVMATYQVQSEEEFRDKVMNGDKPVVVDFSATWCGPCKLLSPRLDAAIAHAEDEVDLAIVDIDDLADVALEHGVQAVPTVIGVKNGEIVDKFVGLVDEDVLGSFIQKLRD